MTPLMLSGFGKLIQALLCYKFNRRLLRLCFPLDRQDRSVLAAVQNK